VEHLGEVLQAIAVLEAAVVVLGHAAHAMDRAPERRGYTVSGA
jgi:hypothetical protein